MALHHFPLFFLISPRTRSSARIYEKLVNLAPRNNDRFFRGMAAAVTANGRLMSDETGNCRGQASELHPGIRSRGSSGREMLFLKVVARSHIFFARESRHITLSLSFCLIYENGKRSLSPLFLSPSPSHPATAAGSLVRN